MSQTKINAQVPVGPYPGTVSAAQLKLTETVTDVANGNSATLSGHEVLIAHNTDSAAHTITISSVPDKEGRTGDVTAYSVPAGELHAFSFLGGIDGYQQGDGTVHFTANDATVKWIVLNVPR